MSKIAANRKWLYLTAVVTVCIPLSLGYIPDSGRIAEWADSVMKLADFFPDMAFWPETGSIDSNLYLFLPAAVYRASGSIVLAYMIFVGALQLLAAAGMYLLTNSVYRDPLEVLLGVTLYLTCPYRLVLCYTQGDLTLSGVWALVPWYFYGLVGVYRAWEKSEWKGVSGRFLLPGALALALVGYGSSVMLVLLLLFTLFLAAAFLRISCKNTGGARLASSAAMLLPGLFGALLWLPQGIRFFCYLFTDVCDGLGLSLKSIVSGGYRVSDFLTAWVFADGKPGLGLGILLGLAAFFWTRLAAGKKSSPLVRVFLTAGVLCLLGACRSFFWDYAERLGMWALKFVSLLETPGIFAGFASLFLALVIPSSVEGLMEEEERLPARGCLALIWLAAVANAIFLCNTLAYYTMPI